MYIRVGVVRPLEAEANLSFATYLPTSSTTANSYLEAK